MSTPFQGVPDFRQMGEQFAKMFGAGGMMNGGGLGPGMPGQSQQNSWPFAGMAGNWGDWLSQMGVPMNQSTGSVSTMPVDVYESGEHVMVVAEIPGLVDARDVNLSVYSDHIVIQGQTDRSYGQTGGTMHISERHVGSFERSVHLPVRVKRTSTRARYKDGLLFVTLQKSGNSSTNDGQTVAIDFS